MNRRQFVYFAVLLPLLAGLGACGSRVFRQPEVQLQGIQLGGLGLRGGTLLVDLRIRNPNRFALNAEGLKYELWIGDRESAQRADVDSLWIPFASGTYDKPFRVGAGETGSVQIPIDFSYSALSGAAGSLLRRGTFDYRASGEVDVRTPLGTHDVPFRRTGTVTVAGVR